MDKPTAPVFIVGCPRSGTTLLRLMIDSHPRLSSGPETQFLTELEPIFGPHWERLSLFGFDQDYWYAKIAKFFGSIQQDYADRRGKQRWVEKSPIYSQHLPFIERLFPDAQYVHIIRDGFDVVASFNKRWGVRQALSACRRWSRDIQGIREFAAALQDGRYLEIRYEALTADPRGTLVPLLDFLGEDWDDAVLQFDTAEHDVANLFHTSAVQRRAEGSTDDLIYTSRVGAGRKELSWLVRYAFMRYSGTLYGQLGYG